MKKFIPYFISFMIIVVAYIGFQLKRIYTTRLQNEFIKGQDQGQKELVGQIVKTYQSGQRIHGNIEMDSEKVEVDFTPTPFCVTSTKK